MERDLFIAILRTDFPAFVQRAITEIEPQTNLVMEDYILYLTETLTAVAEGSIKHLIINLPPRHLKSLLTTVFLPAWLLGKNPAMRIIIVGHQTDLAEKFSRYVRQIIGSTWYREVFPKTKLSSDHNTASEFLTTLAGGLRATSVNAGIIGHGGDLIIIDDPLDANKASSQVERDNVKSFFDQSLSSRINNPRTGAIIVVAQRLHEDDLPGYLLGMGYWTHVSLPFLATEDVAYPIGSRMWHRKAGEPLSPVRFGADEIAAVRKRYPPHIFGTQWQQRPTSMDAGWVKDSDFPRSPGQPKLYSRCIMSWDLAQKSAATSDYSACVIAYEVQEKLFIAEVWRGREDYMNLCSVADRLVQVWAPTDILVEDTALGPALANHFNRSGHRAVSINVGNQSKQDRFQNHLNRFKAGDVVLCSPAPWISTFIDEMVRFPFARNDDQLDGLLQILTWLVENPPAPRPVIARNIARTRQPHPMRDPRNFMRPRFRL
jgi:predicted phage terminase large subunit-like protein